MKPSIRFPQTLVVAALLRLSTATAQAQLSWVAENDAITITGGCPSSLGALSIPDTINGLPVRRIRARAFSNCTTLTSITLPNNLTFIPSYAFFYCTGLTNVSIPNSVTGIGEFAFSGCSKLTGTTIPSNVASIGIEAFSGCTRLTSITIPDRMHAIEEAAFRYCTGLTSVIIPNRVSFIGDFAFQGCTELTNVTIPDRVEIMGYAAFGGCTGLRSVTIPNNTLGVFPAAFMDCTNLTSITIPNSVTFVLAGVLGGCTSLASILVDSTHPSYSSHDGVLYNKRRTELIMCPEGKTGGYSIPVGVTSIGDSAFQGCAKLTSITIPEGVTNIGRAAFQGCSGLSSITIPQSATNIDWSAFSGCTGLAGIVVDSANPKYSSSEGVLYNKEQSVLIMYPANKAGSYAIPDSVTNVFDYSFANCNMLTSITIGEGVKFIGNFAFRGCTGLTHLTIPRGVTRILQYAFSGCTGLTNIAVHPLNPNFSSPDGILFNKDQSVLEIFPGGRVGKCTVSKNVTMIMWSAFSGCTGLTSIQVDSQNPVYSSVDGVLFDKNQIRLITCPAGKVGGFVIPRTVLVVGMEAFAGCAGVTDIVIPDLVGFLGDFAFQGCTGLTSITIPNSVESIGESMFSSCTRLEGIYFQGNVPAGNPWIPYEDNHATVYYLAGRFGWRSGFAGRPTALWTKPFLHGLSAAGEGKGFGFRGSWVPGATQVVEASDNLGTWTPVQTNTPADGSWEFRDADWRNHPQRSYRVRSR